MALETTEFTIRPNASFPRPGWPWFLGLLVFVSLLIALRFAWLGFWMILPFTLLELAFLMAMVWLVKNRANFVEKVSISREQVIIEHLQKNKDAQWSFPLYWSRVELRKPGHRWYPHRLLIGTSGKWVEIGQCLNEEERAGLADAIRTEINRQKTVEVTRNA
ncbi:MAG: DUF2244 domain-containing protein [Acidiferrobacterales bacterium]|nr:DUF2244 domain-containing protein [Acidiferrobacterales bacterium]